MQLYVLGRSGSINLPYGSAMVDFGQLMVIPALVSHVLALLPGVVILVLGLRTRARRAGGATCRRRRSAACWRARRRHHGAARDRRRLPQHAGAACRWMFGLFVGLAVAMDYALTRTRWGRSMNAVGGNREAARRAGINVRRDLHQRLRAVREPRRARRRAAAARLASASQQAGTGDVNLNAIAAAVIGGTSLFGGRGSAYSAVLGIIVIQSIASGLTLLNLSSSLRFMITGAVLAIAVIVDSLARQSRVIARPRLNRLNRRIVNDQYP